MNLLLLTVFLVFGVEQLIVCVRKNKTTVVEDNELPDWQTLWEKANFTGTRRTRKPKPTIKKEIRPKLFPNLSTIVAAFERAKTESVYRVEASDVMKGFDEDCMVDPEHKSFEQEKTPVLRKPYVVLESDYISYKRSFISRVARRLDAVLMKNPPTCLYSYRNLFPYTNSLRTALYSLGEYAISYNITLEWERRVVLLTGSWADRTAYVVCKAFRLLQMPPVGDQVYLWPKDLLRPDVMVFIHNYTHVSDIPVTSRHYYKTKQLEWYKKCQGPQVVIINSTHYEFVEDLVEKVISVVRETAGNHTDVSCIPLEDNTRTYKTKKKRKRAKRRPIIKLNSTIGICTTDHALHDVTLMTTNASPISVVTTPSKTYEGMRDDVIFPSAIVPTGTSTESVTQVSNVTHQKT